MQRARRPHQETHVPAGHQRRARHGLHLVSGSNRAAARFAELGAVLVVVELVLDADKRTSEKALAVLDGVLCADTGLRSACAYALVMPVLVKKMLRMSYMATWFVVSVLWRLCRAADTGAGECCNILQDKTYSRMTRIFYPITEYSYTK